MGTNAVRTQIPFVLFKDLAVLKMSLTAQQQELAASYAALILSDSAQEVTEDSIKTVLDAAGIKVEPYVPMLFARATVGLDIADLMTKVGGSGAAAASAGDSGVGAVAEAVVEEAAKSESESDDDIGFSLFD